MKAPAVHLSHNQPTQLRVRLDRTYNSGIFPQATVLPHTYIFYSIVSTGVNESSSLINSLSDSELTRFHTHPPVWLLVFSSFYSGLIDTTSPFFFFPFVLILIIPRSRKSQLKEPLTIDSIIKFKVFPDSSASVNESLFLRAELRNEWLINVDTYRLC